jgi:hypothetical protein
VRAVPRNRSARQPNGQEELHMAGAQAKLGIASRHFEQWINCNLRPPIVFGRRQETVFDPEFQVSHADCCRLSRVGVIAEEECAMDLQVGRDPVVGINAGQCPGMFNSTKSPERKEVNLPVLRLDGLGIIGAEWRPGMSRPERGLSGNQDGARPAQLPRI